jgi:hypothetical protein
MNTNTSQSRARVLETKYVWAPTISEAMELAHQLEFRGWRVQGYPSPMTWNGTYGTGVSITRIADV